MYRTEKEWAEKFIALGAFWIHDGNPNRPHALLTRGKHSNGFFDGTKVIQRPSLLGEACNDLLEGSDAGNLTPDWVIGSALGAIPIAHEFARQLDIMAGFTERAMDESMGLKRFTLKPGSEVLVVEDTITTGMTTEETVEALEGAGAIIQPPIYALMNRSGRAKLTGLPIIALVNREMPIWKPEECPLCTVGSEAVRPKENWKKLNAEY